MKPVGILAGFLMMWGAAGAYPEGAPWGAAELDGAETCSTCHFDSEVEKDSGLITLDGLPERVTLGETYKLSLQFAPSGAAVAGFMLTANAGAFHHAKKGTEANEQDVRSTAPVPAQDGASWIVTWTAPEEADDEILFFAAINGANNDMSSFGDRIYFRTFAVKLGE